MSFRLLQRREEEGGEDHMLSCHLRLHSTRIHWPHPLLINLGVQGNFAPGPPETLQTAQGVVLKSTHMYVFTLDLIAVVECCILQAAPKCTAHHPPS